MTDCNLIRDELVKITGMREEEVQRYDSQIENTAKYICSLLKSSELENDSRTVHLCASKVYYKIALLQYSSDNVASFKAGDISYTRDSSFLENVKALMTLALEECRDFVSLDNFVFEAV